MGRSGLARTIPQGFESGSDVAIMCLLGYAPAKYLTGRAPLEAAAQRIPLSPTDWVFRCNLVTVDDGIMKDHSAGGITDAEARRLIGDLARALDHRDFELHTGVSYRHLLVYRGQSDFAVTTKPPHEIPDEPMAGYRPKGQSAEMLNQIMDLSARVFENHDVNVARRAKGLRPASMVWLWGQGHAPQMPTFADRFNVSPGAAISSVDLLRGLAVLLGWDVLQVPGLTSYHDTNYAGQGEATVAALDKYDIVFSHVEAPDEAGHQADHKTKVAAIEHIDRHIVGPTLAKLQTFPEWRILVMPDHSTLISNRKHGYAPAPFTIAGTDIKSVPLPHYCEKTAATTGLHLDPADLLMPYFLRGGQD